VTRPPGDPTRAVAYLRVSTEEQHTGPEAQRAAIESWAARAGVKVEAWFEDRISGVKQPADRPGLLDALGTLQASGCGILIAAKRDRLARDVVVAATIDRLVQAAGARVVTADGVSAEDTPEGALMRTLLDAFAAYERAMIRARTRAALAVKRARGLRVSGRAPYGYQIAANGHLQPEAREAEMVREASRLRAQGLSLRDVSRALWRAGRGTRGGEPLAATQVARLLRATPARETR